MPSWTPRVVDQRRRDALVVFITVILAIPDNMGAGKTAVGLTVALSVWYLLAERRRFRGRMVGAVYALTRVEGLRRRAE